MTDFSDRTAGPLGVLRPIRRIGSLLCLFAILTFIGCFFVNVFIFVWSTTVVVPNIAVEIPSNTPITVEFSEPMNTTSVENAFSILPKVNGVFNWSADNKTMFFIPSEELQLNKWHVVKIDDTAKDVAGNSLAESVMWEFKPTYSVSVKKSEASLPKMVLHSVVNQTSADEKKDVEKPYVKSTKPVTFYDYLYVCTPYIVPIFVMDGKVLLAFYFLIATVLLISVGLVCVKEGLFKKLAQAIKSVRRPPPQSRETLIIVAQLFFAVLFIQTVYILFLLLMGVDVTPPKIDLTAWQFLYKLAAAAVYEEFLSKTLMIGVPLIFIQLILTKKTSIKYLVKGTGRFDLIAFVLTVFSALVFATAHYFGGWGAWKVLPAFVAGLACGYLFFIKGVWAAIIFHFANNFLNAALITENKQIELILGLLILLWIFIGIVYFLYYSTLFGIFLKNLVGVKRIEPPPPEQAWFKYKCDVCGWLEARYLSDGTLECLRCGARKKS